MTARHGDHPPVHMYVRCFDEKAGEGRVMPNKVHKIEILEKLRSVDSRAVIAS